MLHVCVLHKGAKDFLQACRSVSTTHSKKQNKTHSWKYNKNKLASSISDFGDEEFKV